MEATSHRGALSCPGECNCRVPVREISVRPAKAHRKPVPIQAASTTSDCAVTSDAGCPWAPPEGVRSHRPGCQEKQSKERKCDRGTHCGLPSPKGPEQGKGEALTEDRVHFKY